MSKARRVNVGVTMMGGLRGDDPFAMANSFIRRGEERRQRLEAKGLSDDMISVDSQILFARNMQSAWYKLKLDTRKAWSRIMIDE